MELKKWLLRLGYGFLMYFIAVFFYGAATVGGIIWEIVGSVVVGSFGLFLSRKILNSSYWQSEPEEKDDSGGENDGG